MRFLYQYNTKDNEKRQGEISAASRDAAYAELKRRGIRPIRVDVAPGLLNWLESLGKRTWAIVVLAAALVVTLLALQRSESERAADVSVSGVDQTRRQVIGDTAIIEKGIRDGWSNVFAWDGERFLASFAIPGVPAGLRNTSEAEIRLSLKRHLRPSAADGLEARQIKAIVEGMKDELREYLAAGGTIVGYGQALVARQEQELGFYAAAKRELEAAVREGRPQPELEALWEKRNAELRRMGIKLLPIPEDNDKAL